MPRNGAGTYSLPTGNPVVSGDLIEASWANTTLSDVANELTNSLDRNGNGGMLAPFRLANGTLGAPGIAWLNEPSTGFYRSGAGEQWAVVTGTGVMQFTAGGALVPAGKTLTMNGDISFTTPATSRQSLKAVGYTSTTGSAQLPTGTTAERDGSPVVGSVRFNSTTGAFEGYNGTAWDGLGNSSINEQEFSGNSILTAFTLSATPTSLAALEVFISGVRQKPTDDYTVSGTTLTFTAAPPTGTDNIFCRWITSIMAGAPADGTVTDAKVAANAAIQSSKLSFLQSGTGAVATTVQTKLRESVSVKDFGAVGDGVADDTAAIQAALTAAAGKTLLVPKPTSKYISGELTVPSNIWIEFDPGTIIESNATLLTGTKRLLNIGGSNVHVVGYGATLQMVKAGFSSEYNHGVNIDGASGQIVIEGLASNDSGGDGFYVKAPLADVTFRDCRANNNRRQGLSIIQCKSFADYRGIYTGTAGTAPSAGVDIEPNDPADILGPIRMYDTIATGNDGPGFEIFLNNWRAATNYADIKIISPYTKNNGVVTVGGRFRPGIDINRMSSTTPCRGRIQIIDAVCEDENRAGIHIYEWDINGPFVEIVRPTVINPNQANGASSVINGGIIFYNSGTYTATAGNVNVIDPIVRDDDNFLNANSLAPFRFSGIFSMSIENPVVAYAGSNPWSADVNSTPTISSVKELIVDFSTNLTMTDWRYVGRVVTNNGATGTVTRQLPLAKVGIVLEFVLAESFAMRIYPNAADRIVPTGNAVAKYIEASVRGAGVTLRCREAGFWDMENVSGTWTSEP